MYFWNLPFDPLHSLQKKKNEYLWRLKLQFLAVKNCHKWHFWRFKKLLELQMSKIVCDKNILTAGIVVRKEKKITVKNHYKM